MTESLRAAKGSGPQRWLMRCSAAAWLFAIGACGDEQGARAPAFANGGAGGSQAVGGAPSRDASADATSDGGLDAGAGTGGATNGGAGGGGTPATGSTGGTDAGADAALDAALDAPGDADAAIEASPALPARDACEPTEVCDGVDNDCDGVVDQGNPGGGGSCDTGLVGACVPGSITCISGSLFCVPTSGATNELCNGVDDDCDGVIDQDDPQGGAACSTGLLGACADGTLTCSNGVLSCVQDRSATAETCNGVDDDCDGTPDQGNPESGLACNTGLIGPCGTGTSRCAAGTLQCDPNVAAEVCNGLDDDCDGNIDQGNPQGGVPCNTGLAGGCAAGTALCRAALLVCLPDTVALETCNGLDDDCDGTTDDGNPQSGAACTTALPGVCAPGTETCQGGALQCLSNVPPRAETCNGIDDDCDGNVDQGNPDGGAACTTNQPGACANGTLACQGSALVCMADAAVQETCNGVDDDCDGNVDQGNPDGGAACPTGLLGPCGVGTETCQGAALVCVQTVVPLAETCNGLDDNCDGTADEGDPGGGVSCDTGVPGICAAGTLACQAGALVCLQSVPPVAEACNGLDDDCNGNTDENNPEGGASCSTGLLGVCDPGTLNCESGALTCTQNVLPSFEACNGLDDDCDGTSDDGNPGGGQLCNTGLLGECAAGTAACQVGAVTCVQDVPADVEACNGLDDDCNGAADDGSNGCGGVCSLAATPGAACDFVGPTDVDTCEDDAVVCVGPNAALCADVDNDADDDGYSLGAAFCDGDCNDGSGAVIPGAIEVCDVADNDCNGFVDEVCTCEGYAWDGGGDGTTWLDPLNWLPDAVPGQGPNHCVSIPAGTSVSLAGALSFGLRSLALDGTLTHPAGSATGIDLAVMDLSIGATGSILATGRGFGQNAGPGAGLNGSACACGNGLSGSGAGHGGLGGPGTGSAPAGGPSYDSIAEPSELGSGGGRRACSGAGTAGLGGGRVRLYVGNTFTFDGTIRADGTTSATACSNGGGSGGSVWITAPTITTSSAPLITASGGNGTNEGAGACTCGVNIGAGGGAGGRISIDGFSSNLPASMVLEARGGGGGGSGRMGAAGTLFRRSAAQVLGDLEVDQGTPGAAFTPLLWTTVTAFESVTIRPDTTVTTDTPLSIGTLTVEGTLTHTAGDADGVTVTANDITVTATGIVDADGLGFGSQTGPGVGPNGTTCACGNGLTGTGAGHGGLGGAGQGRSPLGGTTYGDIAFPDDLGSGGGRRACGAAGLAGFGGGRIRLMAGSTLTIDGTIRANGTTSATACSNGGGSGGSIWLSAASISTTTGTPLVSTNGGGGTSDTGGACSCGAGVGAGGGAGGRIAIDGYSGVFPGTLSVAARGGAPAGNGERGAAGTIFRNPLGQSLGDLEIDNGTPGAAFTPILPGDLTTFESVTVRPDTTMTLSVPITAAAVAIDGTLTHPVGDADGVTVNAGDMLIGTTGSIDATGLGFGQLSGAGAGSNGTACTCGNGLTGSGAGHGGRGGTGQGGAPAGGLLYGALQGVPIDFGSGGGRRACAPTGTAGVGGGLVRLFVDNGLTIDGQIHVDGTTSATACSNGGGSAGSVFITAGSVGTNGSPLISAAGGSGTTDAASSCNCGVGIGAGGGGGGRIAIFAEQSSLSPSMIAVAGGAGAGAAAPGSPGIPVHFPGADSLITLVSPADGGAGSSAGTLLSWTGLQLFGTRHFHVEIDDDPHFDATANHPEIGDPPIAVATEVPGNPGGRLTTFSWTTPPLAPTKTYYWHVVAHNSGNGVVAGSRVYTFRTP